MALDKFQEQVVNSPDKKILCLAGAGAGKSRSLLGRINHLIDNGVLPTQILALTFTRVAAAEMRERFELANPGKLIPEFRTFHSFCYSILCKDSNIRNALGYSKVPDIASSEQEKELIERAKIQCKITLSNEKLTTRSNLTRKEKWQVELFDKALSRLMKQYDVITFDVLNSEVSKLFIADDTSTHRYKTQYKYILLDEGQDSDPAQVSFVFSFTDSNLFIAGDALQNIYGFRNCSNEYIKQMSKSDEWTKYRLQNNYRSTKQICEYANAFSATYADDAYRIAMISNRNGEAVVDKITDEPDNYDSISFDSIDDMISDIKNLPGTSAILCRTNKEVDTIHTYLTGKGIIHTTGHGTKILKYIECALSDDYMLGYLSSHLTLAKYGEYIRLTIDKSPDINWFLSTYNDNKKIVEDSKKILKLKELSTLLIPISDKLREIKKLFKLNISTPDTDLFGQDFLNYLKEHVEDIKSNELYVGTIHSVKGLEYDNVCVANVNSYCFQLGDEEMNNLFYVAITRAKNRLFVYRIY